MAACRLSLRTLGQFLSVEVPQAVMQGNIEANAHFGHSAR